MILAIEEVGFEGSRLERLVLDRRFGQLVLFFEGTSRGSIEVVYHRIDTEALDSEALRDAVESRRSVEGAVLAAAPAPGAARVHSLGFEGGVTLAITFREAVAATRAAP